LPWHILWSKQPLVGQITIGQAYLDKVPIENIQGRFNWQADSLTLNFTGTLATGDLLLRFQVHDLSRMFIWQTEITLTQGQADQILEKLTSHSLPLMLSGLMNLHFKGNSQGKDKSVWLRQLQGHFTVNIQSGKIKGINLNALIASIEKIFSLHKLIINEAILSLGGETLFRDFVGAAIIKNGIIQTDKLSLVSSEFSAHGSAVLDLSSQRINALFQLSPLKPGPISWVVPLTINGELANPKIRLDKNALNAFIAQQEFKQVKVKIQTKLKALPKKAEQWLNRILR